MAAMRSPRMPISATTGWEPEPFQTDPPSSTRSNDAASAGRCCSGQSEHRRQRQAMMRPSSQGIILVSYSSSIGFSFTSCLRTHGTRQLSPDEHPVSTTTKKNLRPDGRRFFFRTLGRDKPPTTSADNSEAHPQINVEITSEIGMCITDIAQSNDRPTEPARW